MTEDNPNTASQHPSEPVTGIWIYTTPANPNTYNSSNIRAFMWTEDPEYEYGKFLLKFQGSGTYIYDLPKRIFDEMASRAFFEKNYRLSAGEWYSNRFRSEAQQVIGYRDDLYEKKLTN